MKFILIFSIFSSFAFLTACSSMMTSSMPPEGYDMMQAYNNAMNGNEGSENGNLTQAVDEMDQVRTIVKPLNNGNMNNSDYTRTSENEINNLFPRLPNPNIVMYVYPHQVNLGDEQTPVPGYSTVFPLYQKTHYAMLGEITNKYPDSTQ